MDPHERGLLEYHRRNLLEGTYLDDEQGLTTVFVTGVMGPDGRIYNVPGFFDGKRHDDIAARRRAEQIGWENFPSYSTGPESNAAAERLHHVIEDDARLFRARRKA